MHRLTTCALLSWLALGLPAQEPKSEMPAKETSPAQKDFELLVADFSVAQKAWLDKRRALAQTEDYKKAIAANDRAAADAVLEHAKMDNAMFGKRALALAEKHGGAAAVPLYCWAITTSGDVESAAAAMAVVERDWVATPEVLPLLEKGSMVGRALGREAGNTFLARVAAENKDPTCRAFALYWQGMQLWRSRDADEKQKGEDMLREAAQLAESSPHADKIGAPIFERDRLQIGMEAPDIEGVDTDGTPFKLSDYRGKVVVIDFWGFW